MICSAHIKPPLDRTKFVNPEIYQALSLKLVELDNLQTLSYESNKIIRVHFGITPEIWNSICNQVETGTYSRTYFVDSVYDLDYKLLGNKPQMWLVLG
jgi:hypothetical protein